MCATTGLAQARISRDSRRWARVSASSRSGMHRTLTELPFFRRLIYASGEPEVLMRGVCRPARIMRTGLRSLRLTFVPAGATPAADETLLRVELRRADARHRRRAGTGAAAARRRPVRGGLVQRPHRGSRRGRAVPLGPLR